MIYTRQGHLKYKYSLQEFIAGNTEYEMPVTQHDRKRDKKAKFHNCDFSNEVLRDMYFDAFVFDNCDFTGADLRGTTFYKCGFRQAKIHRAQLDGVQFINCNLREGEVTECFGEGSLWRSCNLLNVDFRRTNFTYSTFIGNDFRKANLRNVDMSMCDFQDNKMRGVNARNTWFTHSNVPSFFYDGALSIKHANPNDDMYAYKLTAADGRGIYHPKITYSVGKEFDATKQDGGDIPLDPKHNTGIAVAPLDWVLREWVLCGAYPDYKIFRCKFKAKDVIENEGNVKFNIKKMKIISEIDIKPFYEEMSESIEYHTGGTAAEVEV